ncbi:MAG TPA: hypothetical protein VHM19_09775, partial [Polyangiales bacterium]|nr:hypothetical protein [Polyangiales bacterium]
HGGLTLVGDANPGAILDAHTGLKQSILKRRGDARPNFFDVVLDQAGLGEVLRKLTPRAA